MNTNLPAYGTLCSIFYDITKAYASECEVAFYASFMKPGKGRVLEAMSGSGRLQIPLLQRGFVVDGVDNSTVMLERCRQRCAELRLKPELYNQALETCTLPHIYTTVTIALGSFQLITDHSIALQALKNIRAHMHKDATLLIDIFVPEHDIFTPDSDATACEAPIIRTAHINDHALIRLTTRHVFDKQKKVADAFCSYELIDYGVILQREEELIRVTWYTDEEFKALLKQAGFAVVGIHEMTFRVTGPSRIVQAQAI